MEQSLKSLMLLWQSVLSNEGTQCRVSTDHDLNTAMVRFEHEGLSFLTITLPEFCKAFEESLEWSGTSSVMFPSFGKHGKTPKFLGGFFDLVFDRATGILLEDPSIDAIRAIRQICLLMSKVNLPCTQERTDRAVDGYLETEVQVREAEFGWSRNDLLAFSRVSALVWGDILAAADGIVYRGEHVPHHGPGATADKLYGNAKFANRTWAERLEEYFPAGEFLFSSQSHFIENYEAVTWLTPEQEMPVKVITVPKTLKTPRIIAVEPTHMMCAQQSIREVLYDLIEKEDGDGVSEPYGFVGFEHQEPNRLLARDGSTTRRLATLDLSEASDRVSNQLVTRMLANHPHLLSAVQACRTRSADVPGHGTVSLAKFASMGSALTFPIEAMVFTVIVLVAIERATESKLTPTKLRKLRGSVRVYGDDIIVPADFANPVIAGLEAFGLKVNGRKSFWKGFFRESCGAEYFNGHDVTVVRCRSELPQNRKDAQQIVSTVALRNNLYYKGLWGAVRWLDDYLSQIIELPIVEDTADVLGRHSFLPYKGEREHKYLHSPLVKGWKARSPLPVNEIDGTDALMKVLLQAQKRREPDLDTIAGRLAWMFPASVDPKHLQRSGRPTRVSMQRGWYKPY